MNLTTRVLINIPSTEPASFNEFLRALDGDCPEKGDRDAWRELFGTIEALEKMEMIEVERDPNDRVSTLILTDIGTERAREALGGKGTNV